MASSTGAQILNFGFGIALARLLMPEDFGMLATIQIFTGLAGFIAGGGMGQALIRAQNTSKTDYDVVFTLQLIIGLILFCLFYITAPIFANWYGNPIYSDLLRLSSITFLTRPFISLPHSILSRGMQFKKISIVSISALLTSSLISIALAFTDHGVWSLVIGGLTGALMRIILMMRLVDWRPGFSLELKRGRELARYGGLVALGDFIVYIRNQSSNFILSHTLGAHSLGVFNKASSLASMPHAQITGSVYQVSFRALAKEQENIGLSQYLFLRSITLVSLYSWPLFLTMAWLAEPLISFVYGSKWLEAAPLLIVFASIGPFVMMEILAGSVLSARNWLTREIPVQIVQLIIVCLAVIVGLPYGLVGVALGAISANIYGSIHMSFLAARCLNMPIIAIFKAMHIPFLMNLSIFLLWFTIDSQLTTKSYLGDFLYIMTMLVAGGLIYLGIFFFAPIESLKSEKQRWVDHAAQLFGSKR